MSTPRTVSGYTSSNPEKDASKCFQGGIDDVYLIFPDVPLFYFGVAIVHTSIIWLLRLATYQPDYNHPKRPGWHLQMPSDTRLMYCQAPLGQDLQVPAAFWTEKQDSAPTVARCPLVFLTPNPTWPILQIWNQTIGLPWELFVNLKTRPKKLAWPLPQ